MGPKDYQGIPFDQLSDEEIVKYLQDTATIITVMANDDGVAVGETLDTLLEVASGYQMLYFPDGRAVTKEDIQNIHTSWAELSSLVVAIHDFETDTNTNYPLEIINSWPPAVRMNLAKELSPIDIAQMAEEWGVKKQEEARTLTPGSRAEREPKEISPAEQALMDEEQLKKDLTKNLDGEKLEDCLKRAIQLGIVRNIIDDTVPKESEVSKIAAVPTLLNDLVFSFSENPNDPEKKTQYGLFVGKSDVHLDTNVPLTEMGLGIKESQSATNRKPMNLVRQIAEELKGPVDYSQLKDAMYASENVEWCFNELEKQGKIQTLNGKPYIYLPEEKQAYLIGSNKPATRNDFLNYHKIKEPQKPNKWGPFEGIRRFFSNFIKMDDYVAYERDMRVYETSRYTGLRDSGFTPGERPKSMDEYDKRQQWLDRFIQHAADEDTKRYFEDFRSALNQHPDIGEKLMKEFPNDNEENLENSFNEISFGAQPYYMLGQTGDLSRERLDNLSALAVAAQSDLFSKETKEMIKKACQGVDKTFDYVNENAEYLSEAEVNQVVKEADEIAAGRKPVSSEKVNAPTTENEKTVEQDAPRKGNQLSAEERRNLSRENKMNVTAREQEKFIEKAKALGLSEKEIRELQEAPKNKTVKLPENAGMDKLRKTNDNIQAGAMR